VGSRSGQNTTVVDVVIGEPQHGQMTLVRQIRHEALECAKLVKFGAPVESVRRLIAINEVEENCLRKTLPFRQANRAVWERAEILKLFDAMMDNDEG